MLHSRYDVELFQRIEHLIGKKLPLYPTVEEEVMSLVERVSEAQRTAKMVWCSNICIVTNHMCVGLGYERFCWDQETSFRTT